MAYEPQVNVIDTRAIKANLIAHFQATQVEALKWANGGTVLPSIRDFHLSPRMVTVFPAITFLQEDHKSKWEDILESEYSITLETAIVHGNRDTLSALGPKYAMAVESMMLNISETTFNSGSIIPITSTGMAVETVFAVQGKYKTQFIEVFQTKATWQLEGSAYSD